MIRASEDGTAAEGRRLLASRIAMAPDLLAALPDRLPALAALADRLPRQIVTTGIGTSEGHARHLAEVAARWCDQPARFASTGSLAGGAPRGADQDWLVVFSQGLSANARHALSHVDAFRGVVLVTGLASPHAEGASRGEDIGQEKRDWLAALEARGVVLVDLGSGVEYGSLLRTLGARAGYVVGWSLLRSLLGMRLAEASALEIEAGALRSAQVDAPSEAARVFPPGEPIAPFFDAGRTLLIAADGGVLELADQLALKLAEGLLRPQPRLVDALQFAHGPLQSLASRPTSILYLASPDSPEPGANGPTLASRLAATLDPALHDLRVLRSRLAWPFAAVEFEAIFDSLILRGLEETGANLVEWPGADREGALYEVAPAARPDRDPARRESTRLEVRAASYESAVWPEIEALVTGGRRTALIALGSIEQHGPHLPLGTDRWIATALADGLAARLPDAVALPAIPVGCASEHLDFAGTLHLEPATLEAILADTLGSLAHHGFERAFMFTAHGGNLDALNEMRDRLVERAKPIALRIETDMRVGAMQSGIVEAMSLDARTAGPHAGEYETSVIAHLRPGSIRIDRLEAGRLVSPGEAQGLFYPSLRPNAGTGVLGDPSAASATRGPAYLDAWLDLLERAYGEAFERL